MYHYTYKLNRDERKYKNKHLICNYRSYSDDIICLMAILVLMGKVISLQLSIKNLTFAKQINKIEQ